MPVSEGGPRESELTEKNAANPKYHYSSLTVFRSVVIGPITPSLAKGIRALMPFAGRRSQERPSRSFIFVLMGTRVYLCAAARRSNRNTVEGRVSCQKHRSLGPKTVCQVKTCEMKNW